MLGPGAVLLQILSELHFIAVLGGLCFYFGTRGFDHVTHLHCTSVPSLPNCVVNVMSLESRLLILCEK